MHIGHDMQLGHLEVGHFFADQIFGNDANDFGTLIQNRIGHSTHDSHLAAAINQAHLLPGYRMACGVGSFGINRPAARLAAADVARISAPLPKVTEAKLPTKSMYSRPSAS